MKHFYFLIFITLFVGLTNTASAQTVYSPSLDLYVNQSTGGLWNSRSASEMDSMINNNLMQQMEMGRQALVSAIIEDAARKVEGGEKIRLGRATTRFTPSPQNSIVEKMVANAKTPQEKQQVKESVNVALTTFNNILKAKRLTPFDTSDGNALAFVLSYLVYNGENPGDARLLKLSNYTRKEAMKSALYQGMPDAEKQSQYESRAFRTMLAVRAYQTATRANVSAQEKQNAQKATRELAESVLKELWTGNVGGIELDNSATGFGDKGERIVKSGGAGATTTFTRKEESSWAQKNAYCYKGSQRLEGDISCFYDRRERFDAEVVALGGQNNDIVYVNAVAFKLAYEAYTQGKVKLSKQQFQWVYNELNNEIKQRADLQSLSDEQKRDYYDYIMFRSMSTYDDYLGGMAGLQSDYRSVAIYKLQYTSDDAHKQILDIMQPRKIDTDYELRPEGFVKIR